MSGVGGHPSASEAEDCLSPPRPRLMKTSHPDATGVPRSPRSPTLTSQASTVTLINALALPNLPVTLLNSFSCGDKDLDPVEASVWPPRVLPGIPVAQDISEFQERPWCQDPKAHSLRTIDTCLAISQGRMSTFSQPFSLRQEKL